MGVGGGILGASAFDLGTLLCGTDTTGGLLTGPPSSAGSMLVLAPGCPSCPLHAAPAGGALPRLPGPPCRALTAAHRLPPTPPPEAPRAPPSGDGTGPLPSRRLAPTVLPSARTVVRPAGPTSRGVNPDASRPPGVKDGMGPASGASCVQATYRPDPASLVFLTWPLTDSFPALEQPRMVLATHLSWGPWTGAPAHLPAPQGRAWGPAHVPRKSPGRPSSWGEFSRGVLGPEGGVGGHPRVRCTGTRPSNRAFPSSFQATVHEDIKISVPQEAVNGEVTSAGAPGTAVPHSQRSWVPLPTPPAEHREGFL